MERGFKSRCEEMSRSLRAELGLRAIDPLDVNDLAKYLGVLVWPVTKIQGLSTEDIRQLVEVDADSWSAITVLAFGHEAIIFNPGHFGGRYSSDVMHELSHLILGHEPSTVFFIGEGELALRGFSKSAEDEANWLAGALLLPRDALVYLKKSRLSTTEACRTYGVSQRMFNYRLSVTGVARQFSRRFN